MKISEVQIDFIKPRDGLIQLKKEKYVYMRPTKTKGDCSYCYHLSEEKILTQIEDLLKGMKIPDNIFVEFNTELKKSSAAEYEHQIQESNKLQKQYQTIQTRIKRARELFFGCSNLKRRV